MATLSIYPPTELLFELSASESTPRCSMTLEHPGKTDEPLAFKVRTDVQFVRNHTVIVHEETLCVFSFEFSTDIFLSCQRLKRRSHAAT